MLSLLTFLLNLIFNLFQSKKNLLLTISLQQKDIEILKRKNCKKRVLIRYADRINLVVLNKLGKIQDSISIVKPETLLFRQQMIAFSNRLKDIAERFGQFSKKKHSISSCSFLKNKFGVFLKSILIITMP